jgi:hypothetical protein
MPSSGVQGRSWADTTAAYSKVTTSVPLAPEVCFDYVADFSRHPEWATNRVQISPVDPNQGGLGARYRAVGHQAGKDWPSELEVTVYDRRQHSSSPPQAARSAPLRMTPIGTRSLSQQRRTHADRVDSARPLAAGLVKGEAPADASHRST